MLQKVIKIILTSIIFLLSFSAMASSPLGTWKTIDDKTGQAKSFVIIEQKNGKLYGTVSKILDKTKENDTCIKCEGDRKNQKVKGMTVIWGMQKNGKQYDKGKILDPESGKIYSATMKLLDNGKKLKLHGYIGIPLFGRSQIWERVKTSA